MQVNLPYYRFLALISYTTTHQTIYLSLSLSLFVVCTSIIQETFEKFHYKKHLFFKVFLFCTVGFFFFFLKYACLICNSTHQKIYIYIYICNSMQSLLIIMIIFLKYFFSFLFYIKNLRIRFSYNFTQYIYLLDVNFGKSTIVLYFLLISSILAKFLEDQRSIVMSSINCLNCKFL